MKFAIFSPHAFPNNANNKEENDISKDHKEIKNGYTFVERFSSFAYNSGFIMFALN